MYEIFMKLLQLNGKTAYQVSKATGISQTTLSNWKKGRSIPKTDKIQLIADYFGVSLNYLLGNEEHKADKKDEISDIKVALFGGDGEVTDEMWNEVKEFAKWVKAKNDNNKSI